MFLYITPLWCFITATAAAPRPMRPCNSTVTYTPFVNTPKRVATVRRSPGFLVGTSAIWFECRTGVDRWRALVPERGWRTVSDWNRRRRNAIDCVTVGKATSETPKNGLRTVCRCRRRSSVEFRLLRQECDAGTARISIYYRWCRWQGRAAVIRLPRTRRQDLSYE